MCLLITFIQKQSTVIGGELMNLIESDNLRWKYFAGSDKFDHSIDYAVLSQSTLSQILGGRSAR
jgi:hypothetical protein